MFESITRWKIEFILYKTAVLIRTVSLISTATKLCHLVSFHKEQSANLRIHNGDLKGRKLCIYLSHATVMS